MKGLAGRAPAVEGDLTTSVIDEVFRSYLVSESQMSGVLRFLLAHPRLAQVLVEAAPQVERVFSQVPCYLELEQDPDGGAEELFCVIMVKGQPEHALRLLRQFDEMWFSKATKYVRKHLNFTVDTEDDGPV